MRMLVIKEDTDLGGIGSKLLRRGAGGGKGGTASAVSLDKLKALNPHVDFTKLKAGAVLLVPDLPDIDDSNAAGDSIGGDAFAGFVAEVEDGWKGAVARTRRAQSRLDDDAGALAEALKSPAVKRAIDADAELKPQLAAAQAALKAERERATATLQLLDAVQVATKQELAELTKLFR